MKRDVEGNSRGLTCRYSNAIYPGGLRETTSPIRTAALGAVIRKGDRRTLKLENYHHERDVHLC